MFIEFVLLLCAAYLRGSISFAVVLSKLGNLPYPRSFGSGNPGASNMLRLGGRSLALAWVGLAAVGGHILPILHRLQGGKGVATAAGVLLMLSWPELLLPCGLMVALILLRHRVNIGRLLDGSENHFKR